MPYSTLFIDLDETVYPSTCGVWDAISERMERFMHERMGLEREIIPALRREMFIKYGTTLRGLQMTYDVDQIEYVNYVHDIPLERYLAPNPLLRAALQQMPQRKFIFTNADRNHARRVIDRLALGGCFDGIIDILDIAPFCKPMPEAFAIALKMAGETSPQQCVFVDDSPRNLAAARALGFFTVQVGKPKPEVHHPPSDANVTIAMLSELADIVLQNP